MDTPKNKRIIVYLPVILAFVLIAGIFLGQNLNSKSGFGNRGSINADSKLNDLIYLLKEYYVDTVNGKQLYESAISSMLQKLDPHSAYIPAEDLKDVNAELQGNFEGIGVQFAIEKDTIVVINPVSGGPSEKVGIRAGDRIVMVNDTLVAGKGITEQQVFKKLRGEKGTKVRVKIYRSGIRNLLPFTITRDVIPDYSVDAKFMVNNTTGYIKLNKFSETTASEFYTALEELNGKGMNKLILDLRGNGGGLLGAATALADHFLPKGKLIVYTEGVHQRKEKIYATSDGLFEGKPVVVIIDEWSASASEILAGALQDNDIGTIVGRRSFGKGLVQQQFDLPDGSAARITIARYHTPTGRCIQRPYGNDPQAYYDDYTKRLLSGELEGTDSVSFADSLKYHTPQGKTVYGGGGIMPDVFVPYKRNKDNVFYNNLSGKGLIYQFAFNYTDTHRKELMRFKSFNDFNKGFNVDDNMYNQLIKYALEQGVERNDQGAKANKKRISGMLKAYIARNLYRENGFYELYLSMDDDFKKALDVLMQKY